MKTFSKKSVFFLVILLGLTSKTLAQGELLKLSETISVEFPGKFESRDAGPTQVFTLMLPDSTANFMAVVSNLKMAAGLDAETLEIIKMQDDFWEQAKIGFISQLGEGINLISQEMKMKDGEQLMELVLSRTNKTTGNLNFLTAYLFFQNGFGYTLAHTNRNGQANETQKQEFFNSLKIED